MRRTTPDGMKRLALLSALLAILVGAFVVTAPGLVSIPVVRRSIAHEIAGWGGRALSFDGAPTVAFRPYLTVSFPNASILSARTGEVLVSMDQLSAQIPLLPLVLGGNIEPTAFDFRRPVFHFEIDGAGRSNWTPPNGVDRTTRVEKIKVTDGSIRYRDGSGRRIDIDEVDARLNWPGASGAASLSGRASWHGQAGDFSLSIGSPRAFVEGQPSDLTFSIASKALSAHFDGQFQQLDGVVANGTISAEIPSMRNLAGLAGWPLADRAAFGRFDLRGSLNFTRGVARLADASMTIDGNSAEGVLALDLSNPRPAIQATLAFDDFELGPFRDLAVAQAAAAREQPTADIDLAALSAVDLDIRLSADRLLEDGQAIGRVAGSAALRDGRLDIAAADLRLFDARVSANLTADSASIVPSAVLDLRFDTLPLQSVPPDLSPFGQKGTAKGEMRFEVRGNRWADVVDSFAGTGKVTVQGGTLAGIDLAALRRSLADPAANAARIHSRATDFDTADLAFGFDLSQMRIDRAEIAGKGFGMDFSGTSRLLGPPSYDIEGTILYAGKDGKPIDVPFIADDERGLAGLKPMPKDAGGGSPATPEATDDGSPVPKKTGL